MRHAARADRVDPLIVTAAADWTPPRVVAEGLAREMVPVPVIGPPVKPTPVSTSVTVPLPPPPVAESVPPESERPEPIATSPASPLPSKPRSVSAVLVASLARVTAFAASCVAPIPPFATETVPLP